MIKSEKDKKVKTILLSILAACFAITAIILIVLLTVKPEKFVSGGGFYYVGGYIPSYSYTSQYENGFDNVYINYGESASLVATLKDSSGKAIRNAVITVVFNGETYTLTTDDDGVVQLSVGGLTPDWYDVTYSFAGNDYYNNASTSAYVSVNKIYTMLLSSRVTANYGTDNYLIATLTASSSGGVGSYTPLKGATVVVTIDKATGKVLTADYDLKWTINFDKLGCVIPLGTKASYVIA